LQTFRNWFFKEDSCDVDASKTTLGLPSVHVHNVISRLNNVTKRLFMFISTSVYTFTSGLPKGKRQIINFAICDNA
jgi:hypothetical protein